MPGVNYAINGYSSSRTTPGVQEWKENIAAVITRDKMIDDNLKRQIRKYICRLFLLN